MRSPSPVPSVALLSAVGVAGGAVMALELCGTRLYAPFFGTSVYVWSALIGVLLAAMAVGAAAGGRAADRSCAASGLGWSLALAGVASSTVSVLSLPVLVVLTMSHLDVRVAAVIATALIYLLPCITLGGIVPYAIRLTSEDEASRGTRAGLVSASSTLGAIAGTFLTGFVLFPVVGTMNLPFVVGDLLIAASFLVDRSQRRRSRAVLFCAVGAIGLVNASHSAFALAGMIDIDTPYHRALVIDQIDRRTGEPAIVLTIDPVGAQSVMYRDRPDDLPDNYLRQMELPIRADASIHDVLLLGGGGYILPRYLVQHYPELHVDVIELDPGITRIAEEHFHLVPNDRLTIVHGDARNTLARSTKRYDVIIVDVFSACPEIPFHVATAEAFAAYRAHLRPEGLLMLNVIAAIEGPANRLFTAIFTTIRTAFPVVRAFHIDHQHTVDQAQNILVIASLSGDRLPESSSNADYRNLSITAAISDPAPTEVYSDSFAPIEPAVSAVLNALRGTQG